MYVGTTKQFLTGKFVADSGIKSKEILYKCENVLYPGDTFYYAVKLLEDQDKLDGLPVVNKIEEPIGLLTKTDILNALATGYELNTKIDPIINSEVWVINEAVDLEKFIDIAAKNPYGYVIVVNKNNKLTGVITKEDLILTLFNHIDSLLNQMNSIGKNIYNGVIVSDREGTIININKAAEKIFDVSASCVRGSVLSSYAPLDEIGDMPLSLQAKILRVLQDKKFERVGGINQIESDIRIIVATNQDIEKKIEEGKFRADLYYRLNVISFTIPPLRDRIEDIPLLVSSFIQEFNEMFDKNIKDIGDDTIALMSDYSWPGNVRELKHTVERIINFCDDNEITINDLPEFLIENAENIKQEKQDISKNISKSNGNTIREDFGCII